MRKKSTTNKELINAELAARSFNTKAKNMLKQHTPKKPQAEVEIAFHCECSDKNCQERVSLTLKEYEQLHANNARFVLAKGHSEPRVEKVKAATPAFTVVEKHAL